MSAVGLLASMPVAGSGEADTGGRASGDSGSLFGDALTAAGQVLDGASDSGTATLDTVRQGGPAEASAAPDRTSDRQAAIAAMTHLVAWSAPASPVPSPTPLQATTPQSTTSEPTLAGEATPDTTAETTPIVAGAEETPVDPSSGVVETDAVAAAPTVVGSVPATQTASTPETTSVSAPASAPATVPDPAAAASTAGAGASAVADGRAELRTQGRPSGHVRDLGVETAATPREPAAGGADASLSDPIGATPRQEPLPRQGLPVIPAPLGSPAPAVGGALEQRMSSDAGDQAPGAQPVLATASAAPVTPTVATLTPVSPPDAATTANRAVAAQVAPVVVSIAQRPMGTHQLTMTVNPDSLGPVTVRAQISASGEVQVELSGATDAGRDALRTILVELRRDLAAVMPHATLSVNHGTSADGAGDRGQQTAGEAPAEQGGGDRDASRGRPDHRRGAEQVADLSRTIQTTPSAGSGAGLDIFA